MLKMALFLAGTMTGITISRGIAVDSQLTSAQKTSIETFWTNNVCPSVNSQIGTSSCAAGRDGDYLEIVWRGPNAFYHAVSQHPFTATAQ